jgi:CHAT domain-containing protein
VHIASHASFRSDNPHFSSLRLFDGPLTVYDIERLGRAPRQLILASCKSGLSTVRPGDELMGLVGSLFSMGTQTLIAPVVEVSDERTQSLMLSLHTAMTSGQDPAAALARAQRPLLGGSGPEWAAAVSFVSFGLS